MERRTSAERALLRTPLSLEKRVKSHKPHAPAVQVVDAAQQLRERHARLPLPARAPRQHRPQQLPARHQLGHQVDAPALGKVLAQAEDVGVRQAAQDVDLLEDVLAGACFLGLVGVGGLLGCGWSCFVVGRGVRGDGFGWGWGRYYICFFCWFFSAGGAEGARGQKKKSAGLSPPPFPPLRHAPKARTHMVLSLSPGTAPCRGSAITFTAQSTPVARSVASRTTAKPPLPSVRPSLYASRTAQSERSLDMLFCLFFVFCFGGYCCCCRFA